MSELAVRVSRAAGEWTTYRVPARDDWTVLDALLWIQREHEPTLLFAYSCKYNNACKLCQARIDGRAGYLCTARLHDGVSVEPIKESARWRDLVIRRPEVW